MKHDQPIIVLLISILSSAISLTCNTSYELRQTSQTLIMSVIQDRIEVEENPAYIATSQVALQRRS